MTAIRDAYLKALNKAEPSTTTYNLVDPTILPAWFTERMTTDSWYFGRVMSNGDVLAVRTITAIHEARDGSLWIDVRLQDHRLDHWPDYVVVAPTSRTMASINAAHVVYAFELAEV
jgi:hypothetical protein